MTVSDAASDPLTRDGCWIHPHELEAVRKTILSNVRKPEKVQASEERESAWRLVASRKVIDGRKLQYFVPEASRMNVLLYGLLRTGVDARTVSYEEAVGYCRAMFGYPIHQLTFKKVDRFIEEDVLHDKLPGPDDLRALVKDYVKMVQERRRKGQTF
jgi:hypothetical protein